MKSVKIKASWSTGVSHGVLFSLIWLILTDGAASSSWIGVPAVLLTLIASIVLFPPASLVWYELLRFVPLLLVRSPVGGIDVAWHAFHPGMPTAPDVTTYPLRLPPGFLRILTVNTVSLLPGILSADLGTKCLNVHALDARKDIFSELLAVE